MKFLAKKLLMLEVLVLEVSGMRALVSEVSATKVLVLLVLVMDLCDQMNKFSVKNIYNLKSREAFTRRG